MDGHRVQHEVMRSVNVFLIAYLLIFVVSVLLVSLNCDDMVTNFTAVATALNNVAPASNWSARRPTSTSLPRSARSC